MLSVRGHAIACDAWEVIDVYRLALVGGGIRGLGPGPSRMFAPTPAGLAKAGIGSFRPVAIGVRRAPVVLERPAAILPRATPARVGCPYCSARSLPESRHSLVFGTERRSDADMRKYDDNTNRWKQ